MQRELSKLLHDIQEACNLVEEFSKDSTLEEYNSNAMLRSAIERQLMIIGEALNQTNQIDEEFIHSITDARRIINFRHVIVHGYASLENDTVWGIVESDVPRLHEEISGIMNNF